ncbi:pyruvate dehydrogenase (acetyl-transferring) E1 component subunit alpha [Diaminobutyricimonas sp. TR449]|uniref:pyruvate dehydrogenase (acetyl-transferring) E1 component subunit alpha n=1 Tax=Diaminobutyricimonas sp. TR449 TaxID=2708076 RepID=UPI00141D97BE|nr:pyruvate dehydrogenase (acetyl-transferring) E1 component subunit alpha [Diaminobutyricimonas sp. TR449]
MANTETHEALLPRSTPVQLIDQHGAAHADDEFRMPSADALLEGYRQMVIGRRFNDQCTALVRQGRLAVYPSSHGQEACQVAAGLALGADDWLFPTYRDSIAVSLKGVPTRDTLTLFAGGWHSGFDPYEHGVAPQATPLATNLLHAAGFAHAAKLRGEPTVVLALCGDGATSEGDFHEALNVAAVFQLPVVFLVQNNGWAISVPLTRQTAAPSLAHKGIGYGLPGQRVDGNDFAALHAVLGQAVDRARDGGGPTLIEAHTYRIQPHTNADDATRYRDDAEVAAWVERDPIERLRVYLEGTGALDQDGQTAITAEAEHEASVLREAMTDGAPTPNPLDLFAHVYAEPTPQLLDQARVLERDLARELEDHR